jgi:hypothetical protein
VTEITSPEATIAMLVRGGMGGEIGTSPSGPAGLVELNLLERGLVKRITARPNGVKAEPVTVHTVDAPFLPS